jgi:hypothetical protein
MLLCARIRAVALMREVIEEFVTGCMRLKGSARAIDLAVASGHVTPCARDRHHM